MMQFSLLERRFLIRGVPLNYFSLALAVCVASFLVLPSAKQVNNLFYLLLLLPAAIAVLISRRALLPLNAGAALWLLFLLVAAIAAIGEAPAYFKHLAYVAVFLASAGRLAMPQLWRTPLLARGLFWALAAYVAGAGVFYWLSGTYAPGERVLWLPARMNGPIYSSMWLVAAFALALPVWLRERRFAELATGLFCCLFGAGYVLQSRSGLLGLAVLALLLPLWQPSANRGRRLLFAGAVLLAAGALFLALAAGNETIASLLARSDALRLPIWREFIARWQECGIVQGCGLALSEVTIDNAGAPFTAAHAHNIYLALGARLGAPALAAFLAAALFTLWRAYRAQDAWGLYLAVSLAMLNFDGSLVIGNPDELWLLVLLPAALILNRPTDRVGSPR